jgi:hypothetical protein
MSAQSPTRPLQVLAYLNVLCHDRLSVAGDDALQSSMEYVDAHLAMMSTSTSSSDQI